MPGDTLSPLEKLLNKKKAYTPVDPLVTITQAEYNRLRVRDTLAVEAENYLSQFQAQLADCEQNQKALYQLSHSNNLRLLDQNATQKSIIINPPPVLQPCPPPVLVKKQHEWLHWLFFGLGTAAGGFIGYHYR